MTFRFWTKQGYFEGKQPVGTIVHREDGPAMITDDGSKFWCYEGRYHRLDGPAVNMSWGKKRWFIFNTLLSEEEWEANRHHDLAYLKLKYWE